jgi:acetyl-CoA carboxylase carboxyltransferase component
MFGEWQEIMAEFLQRKQAAQAMGGEEKLAKQRSNGRLDARQRIEQLVDKDSFQELGTLVGGLSHNNLPAAPADGIIGGLAKINGRPVVVASEDFTVQGGSIGFGAHAKRVRYSSLALQEKIPLVMMLEGAGERTTNGMQRHPYAPNDLQVLARLKGKVPTVALVMGASAGHGALSGVLMDFIVMTKDAALFSAGPPLVAQSLGEIVSKEELGGAAIHTRVSGVAHNMVDSEQQAFVAAREYLSYLPLNSWEHPAINRAQEDTGRRSIDSIFELVPRNINAPYDIKKVIRATVDSAEFFEVQPNYGSNIVIGLARLGGYPLAIVANQPMVLAGTINRPAADKAARFLEVMANFHMPVLFLADNPGVLPGSQSEHDGTLLAAARMYAAQARLRAAKLHVTLRKAFGFGSSIMAMNPFDQQTLTLAFPGISLGGIPIKGGGDAAKLDAEMQAMLQSMEQQASWGAGDSMAYDEIIDPRQLRNSLIAGLEASIGRRSEQARPV